MNVMEWPWWLLEKLQRFLAGMGIYRDPGFYQLGRLVWCGGFPWGVSYTGADNWHHWSVQLGTVVFRWARRDRA